MQAIGPQRTRNRVERGFMSSAIRHITLGTNDLRRAERFYTAVLGTLGFTKAPWSADDFVAFHKGDAPPFIYLCTPYDGRPATVGNGSHVAFAADDPAAVDAFHAAALAGGGVDAGSPGRRPHYGPHYYAAYVRDPDGNKLQAAFDRPSAR